MPYKLEGSCVVNKQTRKPVKCYSGENAKDKARKLLAALQLNVPEARKARHGLVVRYPWAI